MKRNRQGDPIGGEGEAPSSLEETSPLSENSASSSPTSSSSSSSSSSSTPTEPPSDLSSILELNLQLNPVDPVKNLQRIECPNCKRMRKFFCYTCYDVMGDQSLHPKIHLPVELDVIHHPTELLSKSTAVHARVIAPETCRILEFPEEVPEYNHEETVLLFPSPDASDIESLDFSKIKKVVFIDSQWHKAKGIYQHPNIKSLPCAKIKTYRTLFWRHQNESDEFLATIEAIYFFYRETRGKEYKGEFDNLLFYYVLMYQLVQERYRGNSEISFRKKKGYIQYQGDEHGKVDDENEPKKKIKKRRGGRSRKGRKRRKKNAEEEGEGEKGEENGEENGKGEEKGEEDGENDVGKGKEKEEEDEQMKE